MQRCSEQYVQSNLSYSSSLRIAKLLELQNVRFTEDFVRRISRDLKIFFESSKVRIKRVRIIQHWLYIRMRSQRRQLEWTDKKLSWNCFVLDSHDVISNEQRSQHLTQSFRGYSTVNECEKSATHHSRHRAIYFKDDLGSQIRHENHVGLTIIKLWKFV